jgi:H+/Cl- antiporter ClcA
VHEHASRGDFAANAHLLRITIIAIVIGALSTVTAYVLLHLINLFTNLFFFQSVSFASRSPAGNTLGLWVIVVPVIGGLVIGLIAR